MAVLGQLTTAGFISPVLLVDIAALLAIVYITWMLVVPMIRRYKMTKELDNISGASPRHWFFGHMKQYPPTGDGLMRTTERLKTHPTMFNSWVTMNASMLQLHHSDTAISLLASGAPKNSFVYNFMRPWIGDGLLTSKGKKWQRNRHLLTPAFHFNILKGYAEIFNKNTKVMLDKWSDLIEHRIEVSGDVSLMTLDTMLQCAMSMNTNCQHVKGAHPYIKAVQDLADLVMKRLVTPHLIPDFIFWRTKHGKAFKRAADIVHHQAEKVIAERREYLSGLSQDTNEKLAMSKGNKKLLDFLDILLQTQDEDGKGLSDSEIRDEVDTFLFEGHDTTASGISWALYHLAKYPQLQEKCREEIRFIVGDKETIEINEPLQELTKFIKESMRLCPPVAAIGRELEEPLTLRSRFNKAYECIVPKGNAVSLHIFSLHRNELEWENPNVFDPERFTKDNIAKRPPHAYLPFSAGSRNCIGQNFAMNEMRICLAQTLRRYELYLDEEMPTPVVQPRVVLQSRDGIYVKMRKLGL